MTIETIAAGALALMPTLAGEQLPPIAAELVTLHAAAVHRRICAHTVNGTVTDQTLRAAVYATACHAAASLAAAEDAPSTVKAGDMTVTRAGGNQRCNALRREAEDAIAPFVRTALLTTV